MDHPDDMKKLSLSVTSPEDMQRRALALEQDQKHRAYAASRAGLMFGCYRKAEASAPEIYAAATAAVLSEYPQEIIDYITDPRTGLPSNSQWLPSVFEVRKACNEHADWLSKIERVKAMQARKA